MKVTNIKKLLIKFIGGGLINFPTRFLRWIKIDGDGIGDSTSTEVYIKFKAENFGLRDNDNVPDTVDRTKGYTLDEIFDISGNVLEGFIKAQEDTRDNLISDGYDKYAIGLLMGDYNYSYNELTNGLFNYCSYESGNIGSRDGSYPVISLGFIKYLGNGEFGAKTIMNIKGSNIYSHSAIVPAITFEKNDEDGKWYIINAS